MRWFRRVLVLLAVGVVIGFVLDRRRRSMAPPTAPVWPAFAPDPAPVPADAPAVAASDPTPVAAPSWVLPVDGRCPDGYPVKANDNSSIYHVPGGRFYERTIPERCYATSADAERDGYRAAKA